MGYSKDSTIRLVFFLTLNAIIVQVFSVVTHAGVSYTLHHELKDWESAKNICNETDSILAMFRDKSLMDTVLNIQAETGIFWVGGNDLEYEGHYYWDGNRGARK
ncbi:uncharacterized protein LOC131954930 [Physella acuta]|uniref:uncharacterized protein LOC131954930 n=1 Tax=Physella acuta TaxID=109671 RepID=UPI0027DE342B|nr:uncharacterized protein LOC131954930 [Physella acuta]